MISRSFQRGSASEIDRQQLRAAVVEVAVELPREAHAAVGLDVLLGRFVERLGRADPRRGRGDRQFGGVGRQRPGAVVAVRVRQRVGDVHVGELVFDRLERCDRTTEREPPERVLFRHVQRRLRAADLFERKEHRGAVEQLFGLRPAFAFFTQQFARRVAETDRRMRTGRVERGHDLAFYAAPFRSTMYIDACFLSSFASTIAKSATSPSGHRHLRAFDRAFFRFRLQAAGRFAGTFGDRKRADPFAGREFRQVARFLFGAAEGEQRFGGEVDARRKRRRREAAAEFFGEHAQFEVAEADAAVLFRYRSRRPAEVDHAAPELRVVRLIAVENAANRRQRTFVGEERLGLFAQQVLLVGKLEIHARVLWADGDRADRKGG